MEDALDLAPIREFRDAALEQYVGQMKAQGLSNGEVPDVIVYLDVLMDEVESLRGDLKAAANLAKPPKK